MDVPIELIELINQYIIGEAKHNWLKHISVLNSDFRSRVYHRDIDNLSICWCDGCSSDRKIEFISEKTVFHPILQTHITFEHIGIVFDLSK